MVISGLGAMIIALDFDWEEYCSENGIRNPYAVSQKLFSNRMVDDEIELNGKKVKCKRLLEMTEEERALEPTLEEKRAYNLKRDDFKARRIFEECGYDWFVQFVHMNEPQLDYLLDELYPCESADAQCNLFCKRFGGNCQW